MQENENIEKDVASLGANGDQKVYEVGYLLVPSVKEEDVAGMHGNMKELISSLGGVMVSDEIPMMINLAYTMHKTVQNVKAKYDTGYFGWAKFYMDGEKVLALKKKLDLDSNIIRFLILKTVKENTIAAKRFVGKDSLKRKTIVKKDTENEEVVAINKEEIDKEIDAMIAA